MITLKYKTHTFHITLITLTAINSNNGKNTINKVFYNLQSMTRLVASENLRAYKFKLRYCIGSLTSSVIKINLL